MTLTVQMMQAETTLVLLRLAKAQTAMDQAKIEATWPAFESFLDRCEHLGSYRYMPTAPTTATFGAATSVNTYPTYDTDGTPDGLMWNADGTLRQDATYDYYYDQKGNLMDVLTRAAPADRENYYVDALGARWIASHAIPNQPDVIVRYASSGIRPEIVHERVYTRPEGGSTTYTGGRYYVLGPNPDERLIFVDQDGSIAYPHTDRLGSTIALSKGGVADQKFTYGPFGEGGSGAGYEYRYTGQRRNPFTQLYHYKAREYSPEWGRFLQNDPLRFVDGPNMYGYVGNDPLSGKDPRGTACETVKGNTACDTADEAAVEVTERYRAESIRRNQEPAGTLRQGEDKKWRSTEPVWGDETSTETTMRNGDRDWHLHGDYSKRDPSGNIVRATPTEDAFNSDEFSTDDIRSANDIHQGRNGQPQLPDTQSYVGGPGGGVRRYDPATGKIEIVKPGANDNLIRPPCPGTSDLRTC